MMRRLFGVAERGRARIVTPAKLDHQFGGRRGALLLLAAAEARRARSTNISATKLHSKLIVIDDVVHIGSANFDMRSLYLNLEMMLRVDDPAFAAMMRRFVDGEIANSKRITPEAHRAQHDLVEPAQMGVRLFPGRDRRLQSVAAAQFSRREAQLRAAAEARAAMSV